jgi:hypothetical protein
MQLLNIRRAHKSSSEEISLRTHDKHRHNHRPHFDIKMAIVHLCMGYYWYDVKRVLTR